jgi:hypothetical protein
MAAEPAEQPVTAPVDEAPGPAAPEQDAPPLEPGLMWGIKLAFLRYIFGQSDGRYSVTDGADVVNGRMIRFVPDPETTFDPATATGVLKFKGDVRFSAHHGFLFVRIADPWLTVENGAGTLSLAAHPGETPDRFPLATINVSAAGPPDGAYVGHNVALTEQGSELFNEVYPPGERFDDLIVLLGSASAPAPAAG